MRFVVLDLVTLLSVPLTLPDLFCLLYFIMTNVASLLHAYARTKCIRQSKS